MYKILLFLFLIIFKQSFSQVPSLQWVKNTIGNIECRGRSIACDENDNIFTLSYFEDTIHTSTKTFVSKGNGDILISKFDKSGSVLWEISIGGVGFEDAKVIKTDSNGNCFIIGSFTDSVDIDPGLGIYILASTFHKYNAFILKLNKNGEFVWVKPIITDNIVSINDLVVDSNANIYTTGYFIGSADFNFDGGSYYLTSKYAGSSQDVFIMKSDSNGKFQWVKSFGDRNINSVGVSVAKNGTLLISGYFYDFVDFDPGSGIFIKSSKALIASLYLSSFDLNGNFLFAKTINGVSNVYPLNSFIDTKDNFYISGFFSDTVDFDPDTGTYNLTTPAAKSTFILKLNKDLSLVWVKQFGDTSFPVINSMFADNIDNIYASGTFAGTIDFDPGPGNMIYKGFGNFFILILDSVANYKWFGNMGGPSRLDWANSSKLVLNRFGEIFSTGSFGGTIDFDPSLFSYYLNSSRANMFLHKMGPLTTSLLDEKKSNNYKVFPNPTFDILNIYKMKEGNIVIITDQSGIITYKSNILPHKNFIDVSSFKPGIYTISIYSGSVLNYSENFIKL